MSGAMNDETKSVYQKEKKNPIGLRDFSENINS